MTLDNPFVLGALIIGYMFGVAMGYFSGVTREKAKREKRR